MTTTRPLLLITVLGMLISTAAGCRSGEADGGRNVVSELVAMELEFEKAVASGDRELFITFWAEDAVNLSTGREPVTGREAILEQWTPLLESAELSLYWTPVKVEASSSGELGYTWGTYELMKTDDQGGVVRLDHGKYTTIWRKNDEGTWQVVLDTGNSSIAANKDS